MLSALLLAGILMVTPSVVPAADGSGDPNRPDLQAVVDAERSELVPVLDRYRADLGALERRYPIASSPRRCERLAAFRQGWLAALDAVDFDRLSRDGKIDWLLLRNLIRRTDRQADIDAAVWAETAPWLPDPKGCIELVESRDANPSMPASEVADRLERLLLSTRDAERSLRDALVSGAPAPTEGSIAKPSASSCRKVLQAFRGLRREIDAWYRFREGYDPTFTWWTLAPWKELVSAFDGFERLLREEGVGQTPANPDVIVGTPIGRDALLADLAFEWIPYSPEELLAIAEREFAWCEDQLRAAATDLSCDDDWREALEKVKSRHVEPGEQPALIRGLAESAVAFLRERDLVTVPDLAVETWRMEMMSPARQLVTPFFTGGEVISIAFPTDGMSHEQKRMALRGNNIHFAHATVFHELIPGHHLQQFAQERWKSYREPFATPFWTEGWALHWEMYLWDLGFHSSPEDRIGALFWRAHRAARIIFSLRFHLGQMSPQDCVDFLVERVGHERANAEGEVRRAVSGDYAPLYQVAYMIGGLQFRALHRELVGIPGRPGVMSDRAFHDAILRENNIPVEFVRMILGNEPLQRDRQPSWRFDDLSGSAAGSPPADS